MSAASRIQLEEGRNISESLVPIFTQPLWVFLAVLARVSPVVMLAPPTRSATIPKRIKALLAIAMAMIVVPLAWTDATSMPRSLIVIVICLAGEVLLGLLLGSIILLAVTSMELAGQAIGHLAGIDMAEALAPSSEETSSLLASLMGWMAVAIFLTMGGHRQLIECSLESLHSYPVGDVRPVAFWLDELDDMVRHTLKVGIRAAAPIGTALLMANLITGLIARTLPQLNVLAIGFNINVSVMFLVMILSLSSVAWVFQDELNVWIESCQYIIRQPRTA